MSLESKQIFDGNILIAHLLGWKYIPFNDLQEFPKPGWWIVNDKACNTLLKVSPKLYSGKVWINDTLCEYKGRSHADLVFHKDWNEIIKVIQFIEDKVDLGDLFYQWEMNGEMRSNFEGFEFNLYQNGCYSEINLALDPPMDVAKSFDGELTWIENVWLTVIETIKYINERRSEDKN